MNKLKGQKISKAEFRESIEKCKYCNYCEFFKFEDVCNMDGLHPVGIGFCSKKHGLRTYRQRFYYESACERFKYSIHDMYGFEDPSVIVEFAQAHYPGNEFRLSRKYPLYVVDKLDISKNYFKVINEWK